MTKVLDKFLQGIEERVGLSPIGAVRKNILNFSRDGGNTTVLMNFNAHFLDFIKQLQAASDDEAGLQIVPNGEQPKEPVPKSAYIPEQSPLNAFTLTELDASSLGRL